jgi:hypothetical protein
MLNENKRIRETQRIYVAFFNNSFSISILAQILRDVDKATVGIVLYSPTPPPTTAAAVLHALYPGFWMYCNLPEGLEYPAIIPTYLHNPLRP